MWLVWSTLSSIESSIKSSILLWRIFFADVDDDDETPFLSLWRIEIFGLSILSLLASIFESLTNIIYDENKNNNQNNNNNSENNEIKIIKK